MKNRTCNLLLVDDDIDYANLVAAKLTAMGGKETTVTIASNYEEALTLLAYRRFDFAFIDCFLGGARTGLTLLREIRTQGFGFPVSLLTAAARGPLRRVALQLGAVAIIDKARCDAAQLAEVIDLSTGAWCDSPAAAMETTAAA